MKDIFRLWAILLIAVSLAFTACDDDEGGENTGTAASSVFVSKAILPPGEQCPAGGVQIDMGFDNNGNNVLDEDEITNTEYVCNGETFVSDYVSVYHSERVSYPDSSTTTYILPFDSEEFDSNNLHDTETNNSRLTIQNAGLYLVIAQLQIRCQSPDSLIAFYCNLKKNNTDNISSVAFIDFVDIDNIVGLQHPVEINELVRLNTDDFIELELRVSSQDLDVETNSYFSLIRMAP